MDIGGTISSLSGLVIFLALIVAIMVVFAFLGTRSRSQYVKRLQAAEAKGGFPPEARLRLRRLVILAVIGPLGSASFMIVLVLAVLGGIPIHPLIALYVSVVLFILCVIAGFLMRREVNRRLWSTKTILNRGSLKPIPPDASLAAARR